MKNIRYALLGAAFLFISTAPLALADISASPEAPTTPQSSFGAFCDPYITTFTNGHYYTPDELGNCTYALPSFSTGSQRLLALYKGVIGNATLQTFNTYDASVTPQTIISTTRNTFGGTQGDNFFLAAVGGGSFSDLVDADTYLRTGAGTAPVSYYTVSWIYGTTPTSPLTVTADNKTMAQGSSTPALTATLSGFVAPDTATSNDVTGQAACTTTATASSTAGSYPITCTIGSLVSASNYTFGTFVPGTLTITAPPPPPPSDHTPPVITITSPVNDGLYAKTDTTVHITATITDQSAIATTTYWFNGVKVNPANALSLTNAPVVSKVAVASKDIYGNAATSTVTIYIVKSLNSCLLDIISILTAIAQDKTLPDKPTILNLIADCTALLKGLHHY